MFTGLISGIGRILSAQPLGATDHGCRIAVQAPPRYLDDVTTGDSIAINGACMTAIEIDRAASRFCADVSAESLACTTGLAVPGPVNLEKSLRASDTLGGHLVSGHVDDVGVVTGLTPAGESHELRIRAGRSMAPYVARKGSVAVNGVSLTVNGVQDWPDAVEFRINLIPHTLSHTTLGSLAAGQRVNLEIDLIARYVERMLSAGGRGA